MKKKKQGKERDCYPCPFSPEWMAYQAEYREMPLCRLKAEKVFWEESRASLEMDTLGKVTSLTISYFSLFISVAALVISAFGDEGDVWPTVLMIIGTFIAAVAVIGIEGWYLSNLEIDHRKAVWRLACIDEAIERKRRALRECPRRNIKLKPISREAPGYCEMHPRQTCSKPLQTKGEV